MLKIRISGYFLHTAWIPKAHGLVRQLRQIITVPNIQVRRGHRRVTFTGKKECGRHSNGIHI